MRPGLLRRDRRTTRDLNSWDPDAEDQTRLLPTQRRFLPDSAYVLPKDDQERDRLSFQHHALLQALGNHFLAPLHPSLRTILDCGTGTGIWAADMARAFPQALVVGVDVDPALFREPPPCPANCLLRVGDVLKGLPFPDRFFGYTHQRLLVYAIPADQWPAVLRELVRVTMAGGYVECVEVDPVLHHQGPATRRLLAQVEALLHARGIHPDPIRQLGTLFAQAGLQQVEVQIIPLPFGDWGGRIGTMFKQDALSLFRSLKEPCCQQGAMTAETFEVWLADMGREWETWHTSCACYAIYGKRGHA